MDRGVGDVGGELTKSVLAVIGAVVVGWRMFDMRSPLGGSLIVL